MCFKLAGIVLALGLRFDIASRSSKVMVASGFIVVS